LNQVNFIGVASPPSARAARAGAAGAYADANDKVQPPTPADVERPRLDAPFGKSPAKHASWRLAIRLAVC